MNKHFLGISLIIFTVLGTGAFVFPQTALADEFSCILNPQANRTIVYFSTSTNDSIVSNGTLAQAQMTRSISIPAGTYKVTMFTFDGYEGRQNVSQPAEKLYLIATGLNGTTYSTAYSTNDLPDNMRAVSRAEVIDTGLVLPQAVNRVTAMHSAYPANNSNSLTPGCVAFDLVVPQDPTLNGSCTANPSTANTGVNITWSATASGGNGAYTYSWTGTDGLTGGSSTTSRSYTTAGSKIGMITITSGTQSITRNCSAVVNQLPSLVVSCTANPGSINVNNDITWTATASGGNGAYTYSWTGTDGLTGISSTTSRYYSVSGSKTATVTVTSGSQTATANCSAVVNQLNAPTLSVYCSANPSSTTVGGTTTFSATVAGGAGNYSYIWSGACIGYGQTCSGPINYQGTQTATVLVTSGTQTANTSCSVSVAQNCTQNSYQRCIGNSLYWYDSCGNQGNYVGSCGNYNTCTQNSYQRCSGNSIYWYDSCGSQGSFVQNCQCGCSYNSCQTCNYNYNTNANLVVTKTVKNINTGYGFTSSVNATPSNMVMFMITLRASNYDAQNVYIRDILPSNLIYNNQLVVACAGANSATCATGYNNSGDITSGINLGTIYNGQTVTITYQAQVAPSTSFNFGTTTLTNVVSATSSNASYIPNASASVIVTKAGVLGASTVSTGLTNNFWLDSFELPLIIALVIAWMWKMGLFFWAEKWFDNKKQVRNTYRSEKELSKRIESIQKFGR